MQRNRLIAFILFSAGFIFSSCIKEYIPEIKEKDLGNLVIIGQISDEEGLQTIDISTASTVTSPKYIPLKGCLVSVDDSKGNHFSFSETQKGKYSAWMSREFLAKGTVYTLTVITPGGDTIKSENEIMPSCPPVDEVYFRIVNEPTLVPDKTIMGVRFYLNLKGSQNDSRYYRWNVTETWEYHVDYPMEWYYDGAIVHHVSPPDNSKRICWSTQIVNDFFSLTTANLAKNEYLAFPLHLVDNQNPRLIYGYSLLVQQYALSREAYNFYEKVRINNKNSGGLYMKQPIAIHGNLRNLTHPEAEVLGFFSASSIQSKRIFVEKPPLPIEYDDYCAPEWLKYGLKDLQANDYPAYLMDNGRHTNWINFQLSLECVDCTRLRGVTTKPDFWPVK